MIDKKFLEDIGVTDEAAVEKITAAYNADIQTEKDAAAAVQKSLDEANTTIQSFKDMDIDGIKKSADDWKAKAEQAERDRAAFEHRTKVSGIVKSLKLRDDIYEEYLTNALIEKQLRFDGDKLIGGDDVIDSFKKAHPDAFITDKPQIDMGGSTNNVPLGNSGFNFNFEGVRPRTK